MKKNNPGAFGGLLGMRKLSTGGAGASSASVDSSAGGADAAAGGAGGIARAAAEKEAPAEVPLPIAPRAPALPVRMPRRSRHLLDHHAPPNASHASSSSSGSAASLLSLPAAGVFYSAPAFAALPAPAPAPPAAPAGSSSAGELASGDDSAHAASAPQASSSSDTSFVSDGPTVSASAASAASTSAAGSGAAAGADDDGKKLCFGSREPEDNSGYCCFRDARPKKERGGRSSGFVPGATASATTSPCEAIREDRPEMVFERDVALLELRSLLRRHSVEPCDVLVGDLLQWQVRRAPSRPSSQGVSPHWGDPR